MSEGVAGLCGRCGSTSLRQARESRLDRLISMVLGRRKMTCSRCGWEGRATPLRSSRRRRRSSSKTAPALPPEPLDVEALDRALDPSRKDR